MNSNFTRKQEVRILKNLAGACFFVLLLSHSSFSQNITVNSTSLTGGLAVSPLIGGSTNQAIFGFTLDKAGGGANSVTAISVSFTQDPSIRFSSAALYSSSNTTYDGADVSIASGTLGASSISFSGAPLTDFGGSNGSASANFFVVVTVANSVTGATTATTASLAGAGVTAIGSPTGTVTGSAFSFGALATTISGTGTTRNMVSGASAQTLATFSAVSTGNTQTLSQIDFVFSVDIASIFNTFTLNNGSSNVGTPTYTAGTKTLSFTSIGDALSTSTINYTLKANVSPGAGVTSQTVSLANAGVSVTGGGSVNSFTTITNTLNTSALTATISGTGTTRNLSAGAVAQTLATFSATSTGSSQTLSQIDFVFSVDIATIFNTFTLNNGSSNVGTPTYTAGTKTLSFAAIGDALSTSPTNYTLRANVAGGASVSSQTVSLANAGVNVTGGGTVNGFTTITNTLNITYSQSSTIELNGGVTNPINFAAYNKQTASGLTIANSTSLAQFRIRDGGSSNNDTDTQPTTLDAISISISNFGNLRTIALFNGSTIVPGTEQTVTSGTVTFSGPLGIVAADNNNQDFSVQATFKATVTDNQFIQVTITSATANSSGSLFSTANAGGAQTNGGTDNQIQVVATALLFSTPPVGVAPNTDFSMTVTTVDANQNIDVNRSNTVQLTKASGTGAISAGSPESLTQNVVAGVFTWNKLRISTAGSYVINGSYGGSGISDNTFSITIQSPGVDVVLTPLTPLDFCIGGGFQSLATINVKEQDFADFGNGNNQSFLLKLPTGFIFDVTQTPTPTFTAGRNFGAPTSVSYIGNSIVRFSYNVSGVDKLDDFTISGLKAKYTGSTNALPANITVINSSAIILGNTEADNKNHGTLSSTAASNLNYTFDVNEFPGDPAVSPNQTQFTTSTTGVTLVANSSNPQVLTNQVFSGNGVSFSAIQNSYIFSPSSIGNGNSIVTFSGNDPVSGCLISASKTFNVSSGGINGLSSQYCANDNTTQSLSVPLSSYDNSQYYTAWSNVTVYASYSYVSYGGNAYYSLPNALPNVGIVPGTNAAFWQIFGYNLASSPVYILRVPPVSKSVTSVFSNGAGALTISSPNHGYTNGTPVRVSTSVYNSSFAYVYNLSGTFTISNVTANSFDIFFISPFFPSYGAPLGAGLYTLVFGSISLGNPVANSASASGSTITINATNHGLKSGQIVRLYLPGLDDPSDASSYIYNWYTVTVINANNVSINVLGVTGSYTGSGYIDILNYRVNTFKPTDFQNLNPNLGIVSTAQVGFLVVDKACSNCAPVVYSYFNVQLLTPPVVDFLNLNATYCTNGTPVTLTGNDGSVNLDGIFTGIGIIDGGPANPSATFNPSSGSITPNVNIPITFTFTDNNQCSNTITKNTIVKSIPTVNAGTSAVICSGTSVTIGGSPTASGNAPFTYSWDNASTLNNPNIPNPSASPVAGTNYTVTVTDKFNCTNTSTVPVAVNDPPTVSVSSVGAICADQPINLTGTFGGSASSGTWTTLDGGGTGLPYIGTSSPVNAVYTLSIAEKSISSSAITRQFIFTSNDPDGPGPCVAVSSSIVKVDINPIPRTPTITGQSEYCAGDAIQGIKTTGSPGSTIKWYLDAGLTSTAATSAPNAGSYLFTPIVTNTEQVTPFYGTQIVGTCESKGQVAGTEPVIFVLTINPKPSATFTATNLCFSASDQVQFDASGSSISTAVFPSAVIAGYKWQFGDNISTNSSLSNKTISHRYPFASTFDAILTVTSNKNCNVDIKSSEVIAGVNPLLGPLKPIRIGNYPVPSISFSKQCFGDQTLIEGFDNSLNLSNDKKDNLWKWDLGDGTPITVTSSLFNPKENQTSLTHQYATIGVKPVVLSITSNLGCVASNTVPVNLPIVPYLKLASEFNYAESFEGTNGGWVPDGFNQNPTTLAVSNANSWRRTTSFGASNGNEAWITNSGTGYYPNERSVLYGPCFKINGNLTKPVFSIDYLNDTEFGNDGAYVEVSKDDGATWEVLGNLVQGLDWYNRGGLSGLSVSPSITNTIGQVVSQFGWSGQSTNWKTGKFTLDDYLLENRLRIRIVFGSNGNNPANYNGFALDNIKIENRNRVLLAENFTNLSAPNASTRNDDFKNFISNSPEIVKIQYHTNFGGNDVNNGLNPADPLARATFYGVTTPFKGYLDGYSAGVITNTNNQPSDWSKDYYGKRSLASAPLTIDLTTTSTTTDVSVAATIKVLNIALPPSAGSSPRYRLQMAIVENVNGQFILRKLLPDAAGTALTKINANDTETFTFVWQTSAPFNPNNMYAVGFVQDLNGNKEVLQSGIKQLPPTSLVTAIEPVALSSLSFYPVPADKELVVSLPEAAQSQTPFVMYDAVGKAVHHTAIEKGQQTKTINTQDFAPGVYLIQLETDKGTVRKKVMVVH